MEFIKKWTVAQTGQMIVGITGGRMDKVLSGETSLTSSNRMLLFYKGVQRYVDQHINLDQFIMEINRCIDNVCHNGGTSCTFPPENKPNKLWQRLMSSLIGND